MSTPKNSSWNPPQSRSAPRKLGSAGQPELAAEEAVPSELAPARRSWADRNGSRSFSSSVDEGLLSRRGRQPPRRIHSVSEDVTSEGQPQASGGERGGEGGRQGLDRTASWDTAEEPSSQDPHETFSSSPVPSPSSISSPAFAALGWDAFEEHVRSIHSSSDMLARRQTPSFTASSTFHETMTQLFGSRDYGSPSPAPPKVLTLTSSTSKFLSLRKRPSMFEKDATLHSLQEANVQTVENARRGWRLLKQHVLETSASKRTSQAALCWSMLRQTLKGMSDRERTRWDLYRRYGIVPSLDEDGNVVMENTMLSERARRALASGARHPLLAHTTIATSTEPRFETLSGFSATTIRATPNGLGQSAGRPRAKSSPLRPAMSISSDDGRQPQHGKSQQRRASEVPSRTLSRSRPP